MNPENPTALDAAALFLLQAYGILALAVIAGWGIYTLIRRRRHDRHIPR